MPEYIPQWTPAGVGPFLAGYLDCAEWLLGEDAHRDAVTGWSDEAVTEAAEDCADFVFRNCADLESVGGDDYRAGMYFWLSRNGQGAGFFDRWPRLQRAAKVYGTRDVYVGDDGRLYLT